MNCKKYGFIEPCKITGFRKNETILLAYSGGPDSSALLYMLKEYCDENGEKLCLAHVDHLIRENEHQRDLDFCKKTAEKLGLEIYTETFDVPAISEKTGESLELCARRLRYEFFAKIMTEKNIRILATAHNADDNLETVIFNIARGAGSKGASGIPEKREFAGGYIVRPILNITKSEVLDYCRENRIEYVVDSTNAVPDCSRNKIRIEIIPKLREINSEAAKNARRFCESLRADEEYLSLLADDFIKANKTEKGMPLTAFDNLPIPIKRRVIMKLGEELETVHVEAIEALIEDKKPHSSISLPNGFVAAIENDCLLFEKEHEKPEPARFCVKILPGENTLGRFLLVCDEDIQNFHKSDTAATVLLEKIIGEITARNREPGDRIKIGGHHKSLKKLMNEKKVPIEIRDELPVLCDDEGIIWVPYVGARDGINGKNGKVICFSLKI